MAFFLRRFREGKSSVALKIIRLNPLKFARMALDWGIVDEDEFDVAGGINPPKNHRYSAFHKNGLNNEQLIHPSYRRIMLTMQYRRDYTAGATYFFTVVVFRRLPLLGARKR